MATVYGSAVSAVKEAIWRGLTAQLAGKAVVLYDAPLNPMELVSEDGEGIAVFFRDGDIDTSHDATVMGGPTVRVDEEFTLDLVVQVVDEMRHTDAAVYEEGARQLIVDRRLDQILGEVLTWLCNSANWPRSKGTAGAGGTGEMSIHSTFLVGGQPSFRTSGSLLPATDGRAAAQVLKVRVSARREPIA